MATTVKAMLEAANVAVPKIDVARAQALIDAGALVLDVRDGPEIDAAGRIPGARHVSRGMLEFRADPASPSYDPELRPDRPVLLYCASGGRSALAGATLKDLGYAQVYNLGGFKDWREAGGAVEAPEGPPPPAAS